MSNTPTWAKNIIRTVARQKRRRPPEVTWQTTRKTHGTAGSSEGNEIFIREGRFRLNAKLTLLHELAHWITGNGHTHKFWLQAWALYRQFHLPMGYALTWESYYRQGALDAYWESRDRRGRWPKQRVQIKTTVSARPPEQQP